MNAKKLLKAVKTLGKETIIEMEGMSEADLKRRIFEANEAMQTATNQLESNPHYTAAKSVLKDLTAGKKEVDKRQNAIILVALSMIHQG